MGTLNEFLAEKRVAVQTLRKAAAEDPTPRPMQACCRVLGRSGVRDVRIRDYQIVTDTPPYFAGYGLGPSAPELMLGALASCLAHTALIVAAEGELALDALTVELSCKMHPFAQSSGLEHIPIPPHDICYTLHIEAPEPAERLATLHDQVRTRCSLYNLLKDPQTIPERLFKRIQPTVRSGHEGHCHARQPFRASPILPAPLGRPACILCSVACA